METVEKCKGHKWHIQAKCTSRFVDIVKQDFQYEPVLRHIKADLANHIPEILKDIKGLERNDNSAEMEYKRNRLRNK